MREVALIMLTLLSKVVCLRTLESSITSLLQGDFEEMYKQECHAVNIDIGADCLTFTNDRDFAVLEDESDISCTCLLR